MVRNQVEKELNVNFLFYPAFEKQKVLAGNGFESIRSLIGDLVKEGYNEMKTDNLVFPLFQFSS